MKRRLELVCCICSSGVHILSVGRVHILKGAILGAVAGLTSVRTIDWDKTGQVVGC